MGLEVWSVWEAIRCPTLILRGVDSEVLQRDTVERMRRSPAPVEVVELPGIGHAPSLMTQSQIETVRDFLLRGT
jgi:pimeloyl-ACP methyl ester carboxylesterase